MIPTRDSEFQGENVVQRTMPAVTIVAMLAGLEALGFDADELLRTTGVSQRQLAEPFASVPDEVFGQLWMQAFSRDLSPDLPLRVGLAVPYGAFGLLDHLVGNSETVGESLRSLSLFFRLVASGVELMLDRRDGDKVWIVNKPVIPSISPINDQWTIGACIQRICDGIGRPAVEEVYLTQPMTVPAVDFEQTLGAPVQLGQEMSGFKLSPGVWKTRIEGANRSLYQTLRTVAERIEIQTFEASPLSYAIRTRLPDALRERRYSINDMAEQLGLSTRTLQRRLAEDGVVFRDLLDAYRQEEAIRLMRSGDQLLIEVARTLGYDEQSSFTRAFKRWTGKSPSAWMREHRDGR